MLSLITSLTGYPNLAAADRTCRVRGSIIQVQSGMGSILGKTENLLTSWGVVHTMGFGGRSGSLMLACCSDVRLSSELPGDVSASWFPSAAIGGVGFFFC